ncbi:MAG: FHA domain-containing protein [Rhodanobacter sp.]|nr:MAG: FHA domain-containing protein [Rhodanobacter sp.]
MKRRRKRLAQPVDRQPSGPQGTQLFSTEDLRRYAYDAGYVSDGVASAHEPVLEGIGKGFENLRFSLRAGRQTIGRASNNDIVVDESSVSASHGWIINQQGHCVIMNTLSTNGTFVNDKRIHEATLKHGDHIRLGQAEFVFLTREIGPPRPARLTWIAGGLLVLIGLAALAWRLI